MAFLPIRRRSAVHLYPAVPPVCNNDVSVPIYCHSCGGVELAVTFSMRTELKQELAVCIIYLNHMRRTSADIIWRKRRCRVFTYV